MVGVGHNAHHDLPCKTVCGLILKELKNDTRGIIEMARQAGVRDDEITFEFSQYKYLDRFAKLVAAKKREKFCALLRQLHDSISLASDPSAIKAKGEQA
jgi:hypothetical protein